MIESPVWDRIADKRCGGDIGASARKPDRRLAHVRKISRPGKIMRKRSAQAYQAVAPITRKQSVRVAPQNFSAWELCVAHVLVGEPVLTPGSSPGACFRRNMR
jgi:hypothetical protein